MSTQVASRRAHDPQTLPVVAALESRGLLDPARRSEAVEVVDGVLAGEQAEEAPLKRRLAELAGYVGGALVVAAGALFVADQWLDLSVGQQVGLLVGVAVVLLGAGAATALAGDGLAAVRTGLAPARRRLASVLLTGGAAAAAAAVMVWTDDLLAGQDRDFERGWLVPLSGGAVMAAVALAGYLLAPSVVGQLGIAVGLAFVAPSALDAGGDVDPIPLGLAYLAIGVVWLVLAERAAWREPVPARIVGSVFVVVGAQIPVGSDSAWLAYLLTLLIAGAGFVMYVGRRSWPYLAVGVVGVTLAVPEALLDWTEGSLGTAGVLLVAGVTLLGASLLGLRLRREVAEDETEDVRGSGDPAEGA